MEKRIYLDYASTTPLDPKVKKEMDRYFEMDFGNVGAIHKEGVIAGRALREARQKIALLLSAKPDEIVFTGSGTEANNIAIFGTVISLRRRGRSFKDLHFVTSTIEHSSVRECFKALEKQGASVNYVDVGSDGVIDPKSVASALRPNTALVSIMYANNEIGTVQPIREISQQIRNFAEVQSRKATVKSFNRPIFHSDASQAPLYLPLNTDSLGVDLMTLDGHKIYGPKGIGMLYVDRGVTLSPIMAGGGQERGVRSGTENIPSIVGLCKALELAVELREKESKRLSTLLDYALKLLAKKVSGAKLNGSVEKRLPNNLNISIPGADSEFLVIALDRYGISASTKSSCLRDESESYVVKALGGDASLASSSLRFTFGRATTKAHIDYLFKTLAQLISRA
ncbi:MAG: cysteine desulfurase family protein [Patescibacteria group bacterium]